ncbi:MAG: hypothetical protein AB7T06_29295 [Kofleriaceae bacterium]
MLKDPGDSLVRVACCLDPAIDWQRSNMERYVEQRDPSLLAELPGKQIAWCLLRPLTVATFATVDAAPPGASKLVSAFRWSVVAIENWAPDGALRPTHEYERLDTVVWGDTELQRVASRFGMQFIIEIGQYAYERAMLGNEWSGSVRFTLPLSSTNALALIEHLHAERQKKLAMEQSSAQRASGSATKSAPNSGAGSAVHAEDASSQGA